MAQSLGRESRVVGDYLVGRQIGSGSFSVVWHARHRVHGTEVAVKEIAIGRLNKKLQESLMSEISILQRINHPNIIRLHDIIEAPGIIYLILEYCKGGDLSMYIQRHGSVPEAVAKHFLQHLAAGLQILRENNLIHRDLKPQNLLLSTDDDNADLKIADFGFARSLQPRGLAETLCGSPLYMAPEIMQLQKYDAKADLWSVGAILFQLVTGRTPFTGNSQIQLLQNIVRSTELHFPPDSWNLSADCKDLCQKLLRRNPVERLTFEEFFNHLFLHERNSDDLLRSRRVTNTMDGFLSSESSPSRNLEESSQEEGLPFHLDDDSSGPEGSPSSYKRTPSKTSSYGLSPDKRIGRMELASGPLRSMDLTSRYSSARQKCENINFRLDSHKMLDRSRNEFPKSPLDSGSVNTRFRAGELMELIDQDYVLVSGPTIDVSSSSTSTHRPSHFPFKSESPPMGSVIRNMPSTAPMPILGARSNNIGGFRSSDIQGCSSRSRSAPGTSHESPDIGDAFEQLSTHSMTRIKSLQKCAATITELVKEKIEGGKQLEAFSIQLVILAIWKQALHICHTQAVSAMEESPTQDAPRLRRNVSPRRDSFEKCTDEKQEEPEALSSQIEKEFLREVEHAEELAKVVEPGTTEMPDAIETIFQAALALGRLGGVSELMDEKENAALLYSKAVGLLVFLLIEAPSLILNPPFSLTNSDRYRLRNYIDILSNRQKHLKSQTTTLSKCKDQT